MKKLLGIAALAACTFTACDRTQSRYIDLNTGKSVELVKDPATGMMVNSDTKKPVEIYVDTKTNDTIYGTTGEVINGHVSKKDDGSYLFVGPYDYKSPDGSLKVEVEKDGDIKIKDNDNKIKIDGETGEQKIKNADGTKEKKN